MGDQPIPFDSGRKLAECVAFCSEDVLRQIIAAEWLFTDAELRSLRRPVITGGRTDEQIYRLSLAQKQGRYRRLEDAWEAIDHQVKLLLEDERLFLTGVPSKPVGTTDRELIPGVWATRLTLNFFTNTASSSHNSYSALRVFKARPGVANDSPEDSPQSTASANQEAPRHIKVEDFAELSDEMVLALLEEHAKRVVESDEAKLIHPTKISVMPIIRRKMEHREEMGELLPTLAGQAAFLENWIAEKLTSHQTPTASSIENALRNEYRALKARSNGMKA